MERQAKLHFQYESLGHNQTLMFSNSLGCDLTMWDDQAAFFSQHYNILRYDTRGHGKSGVVDGEYTIEVLADDVIQILDTLSIDNVIFCGLSMGGLIGQYLAIHHPTRIEKLILANTAAKIGSVEGWNKRISDITKNGMHSIVEATEERWFTTKFSNTDPEKVDDVLSIFTATSIDGYSANCAAIRDADLTSDIATIALPTLIIAGTQDATTTVNDADFLHSKIHNSQVVTLPAAHISNIECNNLFNQSVLQFIQN